MKYILATALLLTGSLWAGEDERKPLLVTHAGLPKSTTSTQKRISVVEADFNTHMLVFERVANCVHGAVSKLNSHYENTTYEDVTVVVGQAENCAIALRALHECFTHLRGDNKHAKVVTALGSQIHILITARGTRKPTVHGATASTASSSDEVPRSKL